jgi:hypothetical protein
MSQAAAAALAPAIAEIGASSIIMHNDKRAVANALANPEIVARLLGSSAAGPSASAADLTRLKGAL